MNDAWVRVSRESESRGRPRRERTNGSRAESRPRRPTSRLDRRVRSRRRRDTTMASVAHRLSASAAVVSSSSSSRARTAREVGGRAR